MSTVTKIMGFEPNWYHGLWGACLQVVVSVKIVVIFWMRNHVNRLENSMGYHNGLNLNLPLKKDQRQDQPP